MYRGERHLAHCCQTACVVLNCGIFYQLRMCKDSQHDRRSIIDTSNSLRNLGSLPFFTSLAVTDVANEVLTRIVPCVLPKTLSARIHLQT